MSGIKPSQMSAATVAAFKEKLGLNDEGNASDFFYTKNEIDAKTPSILDQLRALGSTLVNAPIACSLVSGVSSALINNTILLSLLYPRNFNYTINSLRFVQNSAFVGTASDENRIGLYKYNVLSDTYTLVSSIQSDPNLWTNPAGTVVVKNLDTPYIVQANELIYIGILYNNSSQTTAPTIVGTNVIQPNYMSKEFLGTTALVCAQKSGNSTLISSFTNASRASYCANIICF